MTTPPSAIESGAPQPARIGDFARLTGVLFSPKATYEDIAAKPSWALPLVIIVVLSVVVVAVFGQRVGWRGLVEKKIAESSRTADMPADQKAEAVERGAKFRAHRRVRQHCRSGSRRGAARDGGADGSF